jgi:hypothetical protein
MVRRIVVQHDAGYYVGNQSHGVREGFLMSRTPFSASCTLFFSYTYK